VVDIRTDYFQASDGEKLFYHYVAPEGEPRAQVLVAHGYAEHSGRYRHVLTALADAGFAALAPDHRGHGQSAKLLGFVPRVDRVVADLGELRSFMRERFGSGPSFLLGHSMGALLSLLLLQRDPADTAGAVLIGSAILVPPNIPGFMVKIAKLLSKLTPRLAVQPFYDPQTLSRREEVQQESLTDPLFYRGKMRARTGAELHAAMLEVCAELNRVHVPLLVLHGGADTLVVLGASELVMSDASSEDKRLEVFEKARHEVLNEPERDEALAMITTWLGEHIP